jgi:hypothetical protein
MPGGASPWHPAIVHKKLYRAKVAPAGRLSKFGGNMGFSPQVDPIWRDIVTGKVKVDFEFLAAKILQSTLTRTYAKDPTAEKLEKCARDLRDLFSQNADLPVVQKDLKKVLG